MTYLEMVNEVLLRLREDEVTSVAATNYTRLIGHFVNDAKRQVEDAWTWEALNTTIDLTTAAGTSTYTVTGSGIRQKDVTINDTTNNNTLQNVAKEWIERQQQVAEVQDGQPIYYAWVGTNGTDSRVEFFPTPDGSYALKFNMTVPQGKLTDDADVISVPSEPVIAGAYARALVERGEDASLNSSEAYSLFKMVLSDYISLEQGRSVENDCWVAC